MDVAGFALITGGASGIGKECAKAFAIEGSAGVALLDIDQEALSIVKTEIEQDAREQRARADGKRCEVLIRAVDISNEDQVNQTVKEVAETFGRLDYVVNAAGIVFQHAGGAAFAETAGWKRIVDINLHGTFFVLRAAAQIMLKQEPIHSCIDDRPLQRGSIVNFGSILGVVGKELLTAYTASKHAVVGLTRAASDDHAKDGLRINSICPGYIVTPMTTKDPAILKAMEENIPTNVPMNRMGHAREVADGVLYLAGGRSSFVTGSVLMVDGGYTSR